MGLWRQVALAALPSEPMGSEKVDMAPKKFARWFNEIARAEGYRLDGARPGGKSELAVKIGVGKTTITRWLEGDSEPKPENYEAIARAVGVKMPEFIAESGLFSDEDPTGTDATEVRFRPITLTQAVGRLVDDLGIDDPDDEAFLRTAAEGVLNRQRAKEAAAARKDEAAEQ